MKITELPPGLRELASKRMHEIYSTNLPTDQVRNFVWSDTPEGFNFWKCVNEGNFSRYYGCKVTNLKLKNK